MGSGEITVLRSLLSQLDADHYGTALVFNTYPSPSELLQSINREFGIPASTTNSSDPLDTLNTFLLQQKAEGRIIIFAIPKERRAMINGTIATEGPFIEGVKVVEIHSNKVRFSYNSKLF